MMQLVQSACPGCKHTLRMPASWIAQAMRCKHCGMILQAKNPPPLSAFAPPRVAAALAVPAAPARSTSPLAQTPPPATRQPTAIPMALPVGTPTSPFADLTPGPAPARPRQSSGGWWKAVALFVCVAGVAVALTFVAGPHLAQVLQTPASGTQVANNDPPEGGQGEPANNDPPQKETQPAKPIETPKETKAEPPKETKPELKETKAVPPRDTRPVNPPPSTRPSVRPPMPTPMVDLPKRTGLFPRRALLFSANNYLYFSPVNFGLPLVQSNNPHTLLSPLNQGLHFPLNQTLLVSDASPRDPRPPVKGVILETLKDFLTSSRVQDRIVVAFIGHYTEMGDEVFLVPVEGDRDDKNTLIPLADVYKQLQECPARQKVLILDVCRFNPSRGLERPGSGLAEVPEGKDEGAMGPKLDAMLQAPPAGVQVWSSCSPWERSIEYDDAYLQNGVFLEALQETLKEIVKRGLEGVIQKPEDSIPLATLVSRVNARMKQLLDPLGKKQVSRLTGVEAVSPVPYDPDAAAAPEPKVKLPMGAGEYASEKLVDEILNVTSVPPIKLTRFEMTLRARSLPPFEAKTLATYPLDPGETEFRTAIKNAQKVLQESMTGKRLQEAYSKPGANAAERFKESLKDIQAKQVAPVQGKLEETLEELKAKDTKEARDAETSKGWLATADYIKARLESQIAYLYEYQAALGAMRKDFPPLDENVHNGWRLAAIKSVQGDGTGKKLAKDAEKLFEKIIKEHPGTPWEVLARRDRLTSLGLEWQATKIGSEP